MMADHCEVSQLMSLALVNAAHGCLPYQSFSADVNSPAQQNYNRVTLRGNESKHEDVLAPTVVT